MMRRWLTVLFLLPTLALAQGQTPINGLPYGNSDPYNRALDKLDRAILRPPNAANGTGAPIVFNIRDAPFGAKGDGSDDTTAIQTALNTGRNVYLGGCGTYRITSALTITNSQQYIFGAGDCTVIQQNTAGQDGIKNGASGRLFNWLFRDFKLTCAAGTVCGIGLNMSDISDSTVENVQVSVDDGGVFVTGIKLNSTATGGAYRNKFYVARIRVCAVTACSSGSPVGIDLDATQNGANSNHFFGGTVQAAKGTGVLIRTPTTSGVSNQNIFHGITFEGDSAQAIEVRGDSSNSQVNVIRDCRFENTSTGSNNGLLLNATSVGNHIEANLYASGLATKYSDLGTKNTFIDPSRASGSNISMGCPASWTAWLPAGTPVQPTASAAAHGDTTTVGRAMCARFALPCTLSIAGLAGMVNTISAGQSFDIGVFSGDGTTLITHLGNRDFGAANNHVVTGLSGTLFQNVSYLFCWAASETTSTGKLESVTSVGTLGAAFTGNNDPFTRAGSATANLAQFNQQCAGGGNPYTCCSGAGTGTCTGFTNGLGTLTNSAPDSFIAIGLIQGN